jgi:hypothetical protein
VPTKYKFCTHKNILKVWSNSRCTPLMQCTGFRFSTIDSWMRSSSLWTLLDLSQLYFRWMASFRFRRESVAPLASLKNWGKTKRGSCSKCGQSTELPWVRPYKRAQNKSRRQPHSPSLPEPSNNPWTWVVITNHQQMDLKFASLLFWLKVCFTSGFKQFLSRGGIPRIPSTSEELKWRVHLALHLATL